MMRNVLSDSPSRFLVTLMLLAAFSSASLAQAGLATAPFVGETLWGDKCKPAAIDPATHITDYNNRHTDPGIANIETHHFPRAIEYLLSEPKQYHYNIAYTLSWFPNHHRALNSAIKARLDTRNDYRRLEWPPAECYLQRAVNFSPNDSTVYMLYGMLLQGLKRPKEALEQYRKAEQIDPHSLQLKYNIGLLMVDMKDYEKARVYAEMVYSRGFPLKGLQRKLAAVGTSTKSLEQN